MDITVPLSISPLFVDPSSEMSDGDDASWRPEQLWLSERCWDKPSLRAMAATVDAAAKTALSGADAVLPAFERLLVLRWIGPKAAALRQAARVLRGPRATATPSGRDLAAAALWIAAVQHNDLLAAMEFYAEVSGRAMTLEDGPDVEPLPPGIGSVAGLASRMRRRAQEVLAARISWPDLDTILPSLSDALAQDALAIAPPGLAAAADGTSSGGTVRVLRVTRPAVSTKLPAMGVAG